MYLGGLLFKVQPHKNTSEPNDLDKRWILGAELTWYLRDLIEISLGVQKLMRHHGGGQDQVVHYLNLSVPLDDYLKKVVDFQ